jgi:hypothetical protein
MKGLMVASKNYECKFPEMNITPLTFPQPATLLPNFQTLSLTDAPVWPLIRKRLMDIGVYMV